MKSYRTLLVIVALWAVLTGCNITISAPGGPNTRPTPIPTPSFTENRQIWQSGFGYQGARQSVSASWTTPSITEIGKDCAIGIFVGLFSPARLVQAIEQYDCHTHQWWLAYQDTGTGQAHYWDVHPQPGEVITAQVSYDGDQYSLSIGNETQPIPVTDKPNGAQIVVESPEWVNGDPGSTANFPNFGNVTFTNNQVDGQPLFGFSNLIHYIAITGDGIPNTSESYNVTADSFTVSFKHT